ASPLFTPLLQAFGFYASEAAFARTIVEGFFDDGDRARRLAAIRAAGSIGHPDSIDPLVRQLDAAEASADGGLRREVVLALARLPGPVPFDRLAAAALASGDPALQEGVALGRAMQQAGADRDAAQLARLCLASEQAYEDLCAAAQLLFLEIVAVLANRAAPFADRWHAARVLGLARVESRETADAALAIMLDPDEPMELRRMCVWLLGRVRMST